MKRIVAIHTVKSVYESFYEGLKEALPESVVVDHMVDEYLANAAARRGGEFTKDDLERFHAVMKLAASSQPDLIVVSCSTLSPHIDGVRALLSVPVVAIDDAMCEAAVAMGGTICVLATAASALGPVKEKIRGFAKKQGARIELHGFCDPEAIAALKKGDRATHDRRVLALSEHAIGSDVIVLAQASMAMMRSEVELVRRIPTLSSPDMCIAAVVRLLEA